MSLRGRWSSARSNLRHNLGDCFVAKNKSAPRNDGGVVMTNKIDTNTVKHIAHLVRIGISEVEAQKFSGQFSSIIDYFNMLNEVDTENIPPASDITDNTNILREDTAKPSMNREEFLKNAPQSERGYVKVPTVLGEE